MITVLIDLKMNRRMPKDIEGYCLNVKRQIEGLWAADPQLEDVTVRLLPRANVGEAKSGT